MAAAARECALVEEIVRIAASRVEEQKERDADEPKLGCLALRRKRGGGRRENLCRERGRIRTRVRPRWQLEIDGLNPEHDGLGRQGLAPRRSGQNAGAGALGLTFGYEALRLR